MPDKGTVNAIFVLRMLVERSIKKHKDVCFIDYSKAFDTAKHKLLLDPLQSLDVDQTELRLLISLYWNQTGAVRCDDDISVWQRLINVVVAKSIAKGLHLNSAKSFSMVFSKSITIPTCHINILKQVAVHLFRKFDFLKCKM